MKLIKVSSPSVFIQGLARNLHPFDPYVTDGDSVLAGAKLNAYRKIISKPMILNSHVRFTAEHLLISEISRKRGCYSGNKRASIVKDVHLPSAPGDFLKVDNSIISWGGDYIRGSKPCHECSDSHL